MPMLLASCPLQCWLTKKALLELATFHLNDYVEIMQSDKADKHGKPLPSSLRRGTGRFFQIFAAVNVKKT